MADSSKRTRNPGKHLQSIKKIAAGDQWEVTNQNHHLEDVMMTFIDLNKKKNRKKLNSYEMDLHDRIKAILLSFFQLADECTVWSDKEMYHTKIVKRLLRLQKLTQTKDNEIIKEYNRIAKEWGNHEPGRFPLVK
jgi:hypothetical protein